MTFHVLIRARNAEKYIGKCLRRLIKQSHTDWTALVALDATTDNTAKVVESYHDERIRCMVSPKHLGVAQNMLTGLHAMRFLFQSDEDVAAIYDGDDWLDNDALHKVARTYRKYPDTLVTYGSYVKYSKGRKSKVSKPYPDGADVVTHTWRGSHLKTFKLHLVDHLKETMFLDNEGKWLQGASDLALMIPIMQLAGLDRCHHISKPIYFYRDNARGKTDRKLQKQCEKIVRGKPRLERLK